MSDPRSWSQDELTDYENRFTIDQLPEAVTSLEIIIDTANQANWDNTVSTDILNVNDFPEA